MMKSYAILTLAALLLLSGCAFSLSDPATLKYQDLHGDKPQMRTYFVQFNLKNPYDKPVWFVWSHFVDEPPFKISGRIGRLDDKPFLQGADYTSAPPAAGRVVIVNSGNFRAIHLPAKAAIQFDRFQLESDEPIKSVNLWAVESLEVNGQTPVEQWLPYDTMSTNGAHIQDVPFPAPANLNWDPKIEADRKDLHNDDQIQFIRAKVLARWEVPIQGIDPAKNANPWK